MFVELPDLGAPTKYQICGEYGLCCYYRYLLVARYRHNKLLNNV